MLTNKRTLGFKDVLIQPSPSDISSRKQVSLERTFKLPVNVSGLTAYTANMYVPIIAANMHSIGTVRTAITLSKYKMLTCLVKDYDAKYLSDFFQLYPETKLYCIPSFGLNDYARIERFFAFNQTAPMICLDVANGYMSQFITFVKNIKESYGCPILAGNVASKEGADRLYEAGADIVKVGIGSGSVCTTRYKTGVGVPQITAIDDIAEGIYQTYGARSKYVCSDGGCTSSGDIAKAFVAGADFVMLGGMLAGTKETGPVHQGSAYSAEGTVRNGATQSDGGYKTSEGKRIIVSGPLHSLESTIQDILGGLRSTGSYIGQKRIENFYKADLLQVSEQTNDWLGPPH